VLLVQVNYVRADAAQRPVGRLRDVLGAADQAGLAALVVEPLALHVLVVFGLKREVRFG
jgi:hypothetical protein